MTYPQIFDSSTGQWTSLFEEAVNINTIGGINIVNASANDVLSYNTSSAIFINSPIESLLSNKNISTSTITTSGLANLNSASVVNNASINGNLVVGSSLTVNGVLITGTSSSATVTTEQIQDAAAPLFNHAFHTNIAATYDDANNRVLLSASATSPAVTTEEIQDAAAPLFNHAFHTNIAATYDDANNRVLLSASATSPAVTTEEIQDAAAPLFNHAFHTNIAATYDDANNRIILSSSASSGSASMSTEDVQDIVGPMLSHANHTNVTASYNDGTGQVLLSVANPTGGSNQTNLYDIVRDFGAVSNEADSRLKIQNALNAARDAGGGTVYVPSGLWNLSAGLRIYSNTTLLMSKFAYMRKEYSGASMLWNGDSGASYSEYSGQSNIKIIGGDWDCRGSAYPSIPSNIFSFAHGDNIVIEQSTFRNVGGYHAIEINSSKTVRIKDCKFIGFVDTGGRSYSEAIQIDGAFRSSLFGEFGAYDKTVCKDVIIEGCYFGPSGFAGTVVWPTGVGSHSADTDGSTVLAERHHEEIKVINNTFDGMTEYAVRSDAVWREAIIQGNNFSECAGGVGLGFRTTSTSNSWHLSFNISVQNNIFQQSKSTGRDCITARNIDGLVISGNHFRPSPAVTTGRHAIYLADCVESLVTSNRIEWVMRHGIILENSDDCMITNNMIKNVSTETANTYSFIFIDLVSNRCSIIGNRMYKGTTSGNTALYGVRIVNGTSMRTFGNFAGTAATTPYLDGSTSPSTSTANA
jgi:hypothetical protein